MTSDKDKNMTQSKSSIQKTEKNSNEQNKIEYEKKINEGQDLLFKKGDYEKARAVLMSAIILKQDDEKLYYYLGLANYYLKKYSESFQALDKSIQLNPNFDLAYEARGDLNYYLKNYEETINDYTQALKFNSNIIVGVDEIYKRRGDCYYNLGKFTEAKLDYETVVNRNPYDSEAFFKLGMCYDRLGNSEEALKNIEQAKKLGYFK